MSEPRPRLAVLISGRGSNLQAFIQACQVGQVSADIGVVISNRPNAGGLQTAAQAGLETLVLDHKRFPSREAFDAELARALHSAKIDLIILAGFMRILTADFVNQFQGRLVNIHPSLLPKYPGLNTHDRAIDNGDSVAGATVHYVTPDLDGGPPIVHVKCPIRPDDTGASLAARLLPMEHMIYPAAVQLHLTKRVYLAEGHAYFDGKPLPPDGIDWAALPPQDAC